MTLREPTEDPRDTDLGRDLRLGTTDTERGLIDWNGDIRQAGRPKRLEETSQYCDGEDSGRIDQMGRI